MPRTAQRRHIERGIYRFGNKGAWEIRATVGRHTYYETAKPDTTLKEARIIRDTLKSTGQTDTPRAERGTVREAVPLYLRLKAHLRSVADLEDDLIAWCARVGELQRHRLSEHDIYAARADWLAKQTSPKTINDRVATLRNFLRLVDGKRAIAIFDDLDPLPVPRTPIQRVSNETILAVDLRLQEHERDGNHSVLKTGKTRARFRVLVSTGRRHCEIMRAEPSDVDLTARVWVPRDAKGGYTPGIYLNDDMLAAWRLFVEADAWGAFNLGSFTRRLRHAGWPAGVKVYMARHTFGIAMSEAGVDLADVGTALGHRDGSRVTRKHYVPILNSRIQLAAEKMEGRFEGWRVVPAHDPVRKRKAPQD